MFSPRCDGLFDVQFFANLEDSLDPVLKHYPIVLVAPSDGPALESQNLDVLLELKRSSIGVFNGLLVLADLLALVSIRFLSAPLQAQLLAKLYAFNQPCLITKR